MLQRLRRFIETPLGQHRPGASQVVHIDGVPLPVNCVFNPRARRYRLGLDRAGDPRLTIPKRGSLQEAQRFAQQHVDWLLRQIERRAATRQRHEAYSAGDTILFRGKEVRFQIDRADSRAVVRFAGETIPTANAIGTVTATPRAEVVRWMRSLAARELPVRTLELAALHAIEVAKVTVRNPRTRWGSCSARRTLSLNWRLVQVPPSVRDYVIIHELMHIREMNHSKRYWRLVEAACPDFREAERWLKTHGRILSAGD